MKVNTDTEVVKTVREGLKARGGYCPCLVEATQDTKCPCRSMREDQECHCGLYIKD